MKLWQIALAVVLVVGLFFAMLIGFAVGTPYFRPELTTPGPEPVSWTTYVDDRLGFAVDLPSNFVADVGSDSSGVRFRLDGTSLVLIGWMDEAQADDHGLWADHDPVGDAELDGVAGKRYVYNHFDAITGVRTHATVIPYRGKFLSLSMRTRKASLLEDFGLKPREDPPPNAVQQRIAASFRFTLPGEPLEPGLRQPAEP
ncbi:MAG: hypothetical protein V3T53_13910 [Phycisphaerales bacterium]